MPKPSPNADNSMQVDMRRKIARETRKQGRPNGVYPLDCGLITQFKIWSVTVKNRIG